ncbi:hypothetical protein A2U01_0099410, partial [Trifolium medium]|nr:hypothetical protein [Trifolium medium]
MGRNSGTRLNEVAPQGLT